MIYNEDCLETIKRENINFDYIFCVPPDFSELGLNPEDPNYFNWLETVFLSLTRKTDLITIAITDRKYDSRIIPKHFHIIKIFEKFGWNTISLKIWHKSTKINLFRLNYTNIMTFSSNKKVKQNHPKEYEYDVYLVKEDKYKTFKFGFPTEIVSHFINNFTQPNDIVYDPFMGSGTTAIAALKNNRQYLGSEINKETFDLCLDRVKNHI